MGSLKTSRCTRADAGRHRSDRHKSRLFQVVTSEPRHCEGGCECHRCRVAAKETQRLRDDFAYSIVGFVILESLEDA